MSKLTSIMDKIGHDVKVIWGDVEKYLPEVSALAAVIFPGEAGAIAGVVNSVGLIQQAVATVEAKFAATGDPTGTGPQKLAQVLAIVTPSVTQLLSSAKIEANTAQITSIVNAVVAVLNVQSTVTA